jgi:hypothetical protein
MNSRAHRAWKDAWFSFRSLTWSTLGDPGWCWFSMALQRYRQEEEKILDALQTEFDDLSWWQSWRNWNEQYEQVLPTSEDLRWGRLSSPLPSEVPSPPTEPEGLWSQAQYLWTSDDPRLSIGGAAILVALARGRATRQIQGN